MIAMALSLSQLFTAISEGIPREVAASFKKLLEEKHLYQSLDIDVDAAVKEITKQAENLTIVQGAEEYGASIFIKPWIAADPRERESLSALGGAFKLPHVKTFCEQCDRIEPFNPVAAVDLLDPAPGNKHYTSSSSGVVQQFALSYLCQGCKLVPEVFIVRRAGRKLTICGRSPMEHVEVAKYIPPTAKKYISGAIVAHQSGQTLAGLFLLRTSIEQWLRSLGAKHDKADQAIDWYMTTLPDDFKAQFPSLRDVYGDLSAAIHSADGSQEIFDKAKAEIEEHFDARRLYKLTDPKMSAKPG